MRQRIRGLHAAQEFLSGSIESRIADARIDALRIALPDVHRGSRERLAPSAGYRHHRERDRQWGPGPGGARRGLDQRPID